MARRKTPPNPPGFLGLAIREDPPACSGPNPAMTGVLNLALPITSRRSRGVSHIEDFTRRTSPLSPAGCPWGSEACRIVPPSRLRMVKLSPCHGNRVEDLGVGEWKCLMTPLSNPARTSSSCVLSHRYLPHPYQLCHYLNLLGTNHHPLPLPSTGTPTGPGQCTS
jgi:hypothetical protein